jgi:hypothetical protein
MLMCRIRIILAEGMIGSTGQDMIVRSMFIGSRGRFMRVVGGRGGEV